MFDVISSVTTNLHTHRHINTSWPHKKCVTQNIKTNPTELNEMKKNKTHDSKETKLGQPNDVLICIYYNNVKWLDFVDVPNEQCNSIHAFYYYNYYM